jgi:hypothetical protein
LGIRFSFSLEGPTLAAVNPSFLNRIRDNDCEAVYVEQTAINSSAAHASHSFRLRQELNARNVRWAEKSGFPHELSIGAGSMVLYLPNERGRHGNFHPASYKRILTNPEWRSRLVKTHTTAHKILASHDRDRRELDACNSSDALLMNIFCHPRSSERDPLSSFLSFEANAHLIFGYKPRISMIGGRVDCTEIDLRIGYLMIEAKLTEIDFQVARFELAERYADFHAVFDPDRLPRRANRLQSYQLVRGILAAFAEECRYCLICDERRPDLIARWFEVLSAIRHSAQRCRCVLVTWQEISRTLPKGLRKWLGEKYGIGSHIGKAAAAEAD